MGIRRRRLLRVITGVVGGLWAGTSTARLLFQKPPDEVAPISGEPVEVDISKLEPGQLITITWRGKPVWILRRTALNLADLPSLEEQLTDPHSEIPQQPDYAQNPQRSIHPEIVVLLAICTHLGCTPDYRPDRAPADIGERWKGGFLCPCHGSRYDLAGRVFKGVPAPANLEVPPHRILNNTSILIGEDAETA